MLKLWNKPCPIPLSKQYIIGNSLLAGVFVALFLYFFKPFGIDTIAAKQQLLFPAGYGLITTTVMLLFGGSLRFYMKQQHDREASWTILNQVIYVLALISTIAAANFFYSAAIGLIPFSLESLLFYTGVTFIIGLFPTVTLTLYGYAYYLKKHLAIAAAANQQLAQRSTPITSTPLTREVALVGENKDELIRLDLHDLLYVAAAGNYAEVYQRHEDIIKKSLLRSSLSRLEEQLAAAPCVVRCHRSYLVNLELVARVSGNAQGYQLHLRNTDELVPVGRSFAKQILEEINQKGLAVHP